MKGENLQITRRSVRIRRQKAIDYRIRRLNTLSTSRMDRTASGMLKTFNKLLYFYHKQNTF